jgi:hypothetical protein
MSFPDRYAPAANFSRAEQQGLGAPGAKLDAEYARISVSIAQLVTFLKRFTTADGRLKLEQAVRIQDVIDEQTFDGDGVTVTFAFDQEIDSTVDLVRVWVDDVRVDPDSVSDADFTMAVAPGVGVGNVVVKVYTNIAGVLDRMQSILFDEGAALVGYADPEGKYVADNVQDALTEVKGLYDTLIADLGDVGQFVLRDGSRTLTGQWELNERTSVTVAPAAAVGSFVLSGQPADEDYVTLNDGNISQTFEFDDDAAVTSGNVLVAIGATLDDTLQNFIDAVNSSPLAIRASYTGSTVTLTHEIPYALGNQAIVKSGANITSVAGMAGGVNGSFSAAYKTHYRIRNCPTSLRDGDVVVHEQLGQIVAQITAALAAFLRLDGVNQMVGPLNLGGNPIHNLLAGVLGTDGVNKTQLDAAIVTAKAGKLSTVGLKDPVGPENGTMTGPITFGQTASATADADQTTTPLTVVVPTIAGLPQPASDDQPANKFYVDNLVASAISPTNRPIPELDFDGDGVGGGTAIGSLVPGGIWHTEPLVISTAQAFTGPVKIYVNGDLTTSGLGTLTSEYPIEIEAIGDVTIGAAITCPHLKIRAGGAVAINAAVNGHGTYTLPVLYPIGLASRPAARLAVDQYWRLVQIDCNDDLTITAAITADDILLKTLGDLTISSTLRAFWYRQAGNLGGLVPAAWYDGFQDNAFATATTTKSGAGGTAGGAGVAASGGVSPASIWRGTTRPYLLPNNAIARGGQGAQASVGGTPAGDGLSGRAGGRILAYCDGDAVLTGALLNATGGYGNEEGGGSATDGGGGGGGSTRVVCRGTLTNGELRANGGQSNDGYRGGGGLAVFLASVFAGAQTTSALGNAAGQNGTTGSIVLTSDEITKLRQQGLFEVRWSEINWP